MLKGGPGFRRDCDPLGLRYTRRGEEPGLPEKPVERKLAAIFAADIVGYSRLMAQDEIGTLARHEMETMFSRKIFLEMFVKVQKDWRENPEFLNSIDWRSMRGRELE